MSEIPEPYIGVGPTPEETKNDLPHQRMILKTWVEIPGGPGFPTVNGLDKQLTPEEIKTTLEIFDKISEQRERGK